MVFSVKRRVEFRDTDAAGIVHFSVFFPMMEGAEHELLRSLGIPILPDHHPSQAALTWPRVAAHCDYLSAAHFEDLLQIEVRVAKIGTSSVQYEFAFSRDGAPIAKGTMTAVCCQLEKDSHGGATRLRKAAIPDPVRTLLKQHQ